MAAGKFDSAYLINVYLAQIQEHNSYLKAVIVTAPKSKLLEQAKSLDSERSKGKVRSALHGIPILVKVRYPHRQAGSEGC
jgi:amidase